MYNGLKELENLMDQVPGRPLDLKRSDLDALGDLVGSVHRPLDITPERVSEFESEFKEYLKPREDSNMGSVVMKPFAPAFNDVTAKKIFVIGYPSRLGGADTELDHQIRIWQKIGLQVHLLHTGDIDKNLRAMRMEERGCVIHTPRQWSDCRGEVVISYCNGEFLANIEQIKRYARKTVWVNCMPWLFEAERQAHAKGLLDHFVYQTDHARLKVQDELININRNFNWAKVKPYFHIGDFRFRNDRPADKFRFGRVSRADQGKFHPMTYWIYETMVAPVLKEGYLLGVSDKVRDKIGMEPSWIKCYDAGEVSAREIYDKIECFISANDNYENLPRVAFEAMASGCLLIVDNKGGWREQIVHGKTGFLCDNERQFAYCSSRAAFEGRERREMIQNAYDWLVTEWGEAKAVAEWTRFFDGVYG